MDPDQTPYSLKFQQAISALLEYELQSHRRLNQLNRLKTLFLKLGDYPSVLKAMSELLSLHKGFDYYLNRAVFLMTLKLVLYVKIELTIECLPALRIENEVGKEIRDIFV